MVGVGVGDESTESRGARQPHRAPMVIRPERRTFVVVRWTDELLCGGYKWCLNLRRRAFPPGGQVST